MKTTNKTTSKNQHKKRTIIKTSPNRRKAVKNAQKPSLHVRAREAWARALEQRHKQVVALLTAVIVLFVLNAIILIGLVIVEFSNIHAPQPKEDTASAITLEVNRLREMKANGDEHVDIEIWDLDSRLQYEIANSGVDEADHLTYVLALADLYEMDSRIDDAIALLEEEANVPFISREKETKYLTQLLHLYSNYGYEDKYETCLELLQKNPEEATP